MNISFLTPTNLSADTCNSLYGSVVFENKTTHFSGSNYGITLNICQDADAAIFQEAYFSVFLDGVDSGSPWTSYFTYSISETDINYKFSVQ